MKTAIALLLLVFFAQNILSQSATCSATLTGCAKCSDSDASKCAKCLPGYDTLAAASGCTICPAGKYGPGGVASVPACSACNAGKYTVAAGKSTDSDCVDCPIGSFCVGGVDKAACPQGKTTSGLGKTASADCTVSLPTNCKEGTSVDACTSCATGYTISADKKSCSSSSIFRAILVTLLMIIAVFTF